ncbi:uncharacterized protein LOC110224226 [Arabidopsis lyrata subsp. lyrata]|uniref:uncharacterized protein LOC110224226 n=1 Tax=Arabidopsis lyrata subsp. lyrata TaxID=81972 RepID=UPI000A29BE9C|nr:uncharacterized protein LOC110224226 [Arabidopsis lyrata subsp. lyrata]|eukprot:XP_020865758.1 uncharacterized protein LOC110224226 [Arabidopsis lyrata subsp. lyrata]
MSASYNFKISIVEQYVNEEISDFSSYYFEAHIQTKSRNEPRNDDGGVAYDYSFPDIPEIFVQDGRGSGKTKDVWLDSKDYNHAHSYVLLNCGYLQRFERLFEEDMKKTYSFTNTPQLHELKELHFTSWLQKHIQLDTNRSVYPIWLHELVQGPATKVTTWPMFFTRGYNFHTFEHGKDRKTFNYGVCVKGASSCDSNEEPEFYGIVTQILELYYPGIVGLRVVLFRCNWYDSTMGKGIRRNKSGIIDVNCASQYGKYDPFILSSQADQVCFVSYPRLSKKKGDWYAAIRIPPRGKIISSEEEDLSPLQYENDYTLVEADPFIIVDDLADQLGQFVTLENVVDEELDSDSGDKSNDSDTTEDNSD